MIMVIETQELYCYGVFSLAKHFLNKFFRVSEERGASLFPVSLSLATQKGAHIEKGFEAVGTLNIHYSAQGLKAP